MDSDDLPSEGPRFASMEPVRFTGNPSSEVYDNPHPMGIASLMRMCGTSEEPAEEVYNDEDAYDVALGQFMRNEMNYDEFMRATGGRTIQEELGDDDVEEEFEEDDDVAVPGTSEEQTKSLDAPTLSVRSDLPVHVRNLMNEVVSSDLEGRDQTTVTKQLHSSAPKEKVARKTDKVTDGMLGQANLLFARGMHADALNMLIEVIRQEPRNSEAYRQVSDIYNEMNQPAKSLQYGLLSAYLDPRTPAVEWTRWGDLANSLELIEESAACYGQAVRMEPHNWRHYEKRIEILDRLGLRPHAMRTRLQAAQLISHLQANVDFEWFHELIKTVAQYYITINDEERAILALEAFVLRSREFGRSAEAQHETLIGMWMAKKRFLEAAKSIFALCDGISVIDRTTGQSAIVIEFRNGSYTVDNFPPIGDVELVVESTLPSLVLTKVVVCFIGLNRKDLAAQARDALMLRDLSLIHDTSAVLEIALSYQACDALNTAKKVLLQLQEFNNFCDDPEMWFNYGNVLVSLKDTRTAMEAFERVLQMNPSHVDARINLSSLQQKSGQSEKALETLQDYDLDLCTHLPDERILVRQADVLFESQKREQFIRTVRMLLTPYFYEVHRTADNYSKRRTNRSGINMSNTLRTAALNVIGGSWWEKFVKRLGSVAFNEGRSTEELEHSMLHDYALKLIESLQALNKHHDMLVVCCYAFLHPKISQISLSGTFQNILFYCAIKASSWTLAFEYVRWFYGLINTTNCMLLPVDRTLMVKRILNAMNFVFCNSQNVSYHRFVMRALVRTTDSHALHLISGNNSIITGTYRHALGEYLRVYVENDKNPLICLLIALTFTHMACKKDISSRHMIACRAISFMKQYETHRTCRHEVNYNIARMFHQLAILPSAIHFYERVLVDNPPFVYCEDNEGNESCGHSERYDLRRLAAHNLALIYKNSGNDYLARGVYERYLVI